MVHYIKINVKYISLTDSFGIMWQKVDKEDEKL